MIYTMTWGEYFRAIKSGDLGCIAAFAIECSIMLSPFWVTLLGLWLAGK